jgi:subtilisin family serine protease
MKTIKELSTIGRACLAAAAFAACSVAVAKGGDPRLDGEILMRLQNTGALASLLARYPITVIDQFAQRPLYRLHTVGGADVDSTIASLRLEPGVIQAEPNFQHRSPEARMNNVWAIGTQTQYVTQWGPQAINLPQAQQLSTGAGVRVAVLDTGVDATHPALAGKVLPGYDFVDRDTDASEVGSTADPGFGHGTHVAGLVILTAPDARIMPLRVLNPQGQGDIWMLAEAILYAVDPDGNPATNDGAQVVNMSLGTIDRAEVLETVMKLATCAKPDAATPADDFTDPGFDGDKQRCRSFNGAVLVAAAGNGSSRSEKQYPAAAGIYGLLPMGATRPGDFMATFSNSGSWVDAAAPGDGVTSTMPGGTYATWSGTSMAAPFAAGTAALLRARNPRMTAKEVARRVERNGARLCGNTNIVQIDALAALQNSRPNDLCT